MKRAGFHKCKAGCARQTGVHFSASRSSLDCAGKPAQHRALEARLGPLLRALARLLPAVGGRDRDEGWPETLLRFVHRYEPAEGEGPFPTAILLHGCGGDFCHLERWGRFLAARGILAYTIDSFTPRGIGLLAARCLACTGLALRGRQRSRDISTILPFIRADRHADRTRMHLVGFSHGGWTVSEWLLDPTSLDLVRNLGISVASVGLVYPYCGLLSGIHDAPWLLPAPVLVVTGAADRIVPNGMARAFVERLTRLSVPVTHIAVEGVGHAFDVEGTPGYDATKACELGEIVAGFIYRASEGSGAGPR
jgi:dienelactone hydrolase